MQKFVVFDFFMKIPLFRDNLHILATLLPIVADLDGSQKTKEPQIS